jgi:DNA-binding beta-propeller fold protein YncE
VVEEIMPDGTVVHTLGIPDDPADTGYLPDDPLSIKRVGRPFNRPAGVTAAAANEVLVSDGYGNARVHHFEAGELIHSWGEPGSGPGQFRLPHGIATDAHGLIYVADRENGRVQVFSPEGSYVREYTGLARPCDVVVSALGDIYVAELDPEGGRVTILGADGDVHTQFPACGDQPAAGAHAIEIDFDGNIYLGLVPRIEARLTYGIVKCRPA